MTGILSDKALQKTFRMVTTVGIAIIFLGIILKLANIPWSAACFIAGPILMIAARIGRWRIGLRGKSA